MLPRDQRLRANRDFQQVYRSGKSWAHPLLVAHVLPQPEGRRAGISVSKKLGKAVRRNRVRRRLRELLRAALPEWKTGFDLVIVARAAAAEAEFPALGEALQELARRARLLREPEDPPETLYTLPAGGRPPRGGRESK
jgi:ribonuclease P protein component